MTEATQDEQVEALVAPIRAKLDEVRAAINEYEGRRLWGELIAGRVFYVLRHGGHTVCLYGHRGHILYVRV
jgi:hypothetical protein